MKASVDLPYLTFTRPTLPAWSFYTKPMVLSTELVSTFEAILKGEAKEEGVMDTRVREFLRAGFDNGGRLTLIPRDEDLLLQ